MVRWKDVQMVVWLNGNFIGHPIEGLQVVKVPLELHLKHVYQTVYLATRDFVFCAICDLNCVWSTLVSPVVALKLSHLCWVCIRGATNLDASTLACLRRLLNQT